MEPARPLGQTVRLLLGRWHSPGSSARGPGSASWSSSAQPPRARRSSSALPTVCARARNPGASCCSISDAAVSRLLRSSPSPTTREQRCWVHKTANVLNKLPKNLHAKAKRALQQIWMAETKNDALVAFDAFIDAYGVKYEEAAECLTKDRDALLAFYDFPAEHWTHLRTTNPIESTFATVRHRTIRSKGCLSNKTALAMVFKLVEAAQKSWRRLRGYNQLPKIVQGVKFSGGIEVVRSQAQAAA